MASVSYVGGGPPRVPVSHVRDDDLDEDCCSKCVTRVPYATLVAVILNWAGVGVFCGTFYRGVNLSLRMLQDVFHLDRGLGW